MTEYHTAQILTEQLQGVEQHIHQFCSPYSGNCFEVALALSQIFQDTTEGFWSVYADTECVTSPSILPLHITVQIDGELCDAGGRVSTSQLLTEFAPHHDHDLLLFEGTFQHDTVVSETILNKLVDEYRAAFTDSAEQQSPV